MWECEKLLLRGKTINMYRLFHFFLKGWVGAGKEFLTDCSYSFLPIYIFYIFHNENV